MDRTHATATTPTHGARLILLRHGETEHNLAMRLTGWGDPPLNDTGHAQVASATHRILANYSKERIQALYSSPLRRTIETAQPLVLATGHTPVYYPDLRELYFGLVEGLTPEEIIAQYPHMLEQARVPDDLQFAWPEGETRATFFGRINRAIRDIVRQESRPVAALEATPPERVAVVVTHGGVIGAILAEITHATAYRWREFLPFNAGFIDVLIYDDHAAQGENTLTHQSDALQGRIITAGPFVPMPEEDENDKRGLLDRAPKRS